MSSAPKSRRSLSSHRLLDSPDVARLWAYLAELASKADRLIGSGVHRARLHAYAAKVSADPENAKWVAETRAQVARGIPEGHLIGHDELAQLKEAAKRQL
jgi:hypothetical protein